MIMATDRLWRNISSWQAVHLVRRWLAWNNKGRPKEPTPDTFGHYKHWEKLIDWKTPSEKFTVQDDNVAVHLIRNALGGAHHDQISGLLSFESPSESPFVIASRDDITVQVVFFNF